DLVGIFTEQLFFGCEADDALTALAFDRRLHPSGGRLNAMFASDVGHWDVPDVRDVLLDAWSLVERGLLDEESFAAFTGRNVTRMLRDANPDFFVGTAIEDAVKE